MGLNSYNTPDIIPPGTVLNTTVNSLAMQLNDLVNFSIQIFFSGTPTGIFFLQESCDPVPKNNLVLQSNGGVLYTPTHWTTIADSQFTVIAAGDVGWNFQNRGFTYVRAVYNDSSSGLSTATITSARFNGVGA